MFSTPPLLCTNTAFADTLAMPLVMPSVFEVWSIQKQCLGKRRIDNIQDLNAELEKWHTDRNNRQKGVDWQFTNEEARVKLKHLYPLVNF